MKNFKAKKVMSDNLEQELKVWEKTIDVQMHFNELQMKIRNFAVLLVSALVGLAGVALKEQYIIEQNLIGYHFQTSLSALFFGAAAMLWLAFFFMDHYWYYPLLLGAVKHGMSIEDTLKTRLPSIGLTKRIGEESAMKVRSATFRSKDKSVLFYLSIFALLLVLACGSSWLPSTEQKPKQTMSASKSTVSATSPPISGPTKQPSVLLPQSPGTTANVKASTTPISKATH